MNLFARITVSKDWTFLRPVNHLTAMRIVSAADQASRNIIY